MTKKSNYVAITLSGQTIKMLGDVAIVRHKLNGTTNDNGVQATVSLSVLQIWQKTGGEWKLIAREAVKVV